MKLFANILSAIFHPLLIVTYGLVLALTLTYLSIYPLNTKLWLIGGAFFCTAFIPGAFVALMANGKLINDFELSDYRQRTIPYLIFITSLLVCLMFSYKIHMPSWFLSFLMGDCIALIGLLCVNFFWKISAHSMGMGAILGSVMAISRLQLLNPYGLFIVIILVAGLVGSSRILLKRHTPMQVYAGFCLGFICTFVISLVNYIYLFIK